MKKLLLLVSAIIITLASCSTPAPAVDNKVKLDSIAADSVAKFIVADSVAKTKVTLDSIAKVDSIAKATPVVEVKKK